MTGIQAQQSNGGVNPALRAAGVGAVATIATAAVASKTIFAQEGLITGLKAPGPWIAGAALVGLPLAAIDYGNHHGGQNSLLGSAMIGAAPSALLGAGLGAIAGSLANGDTGGKGGFGFVVGGAIMFGLGGAAFGAIAHEVDKHT